MRTEGSKQGERGAARMHWLRQILDRPSAPDRDATFDEMLRGRFDLGTELDMQASLEGCMGGV